MFKQSFSSLDFSISVFAEVVTQALHYRVFTGGIMTHALHYQLQFRPDL